MQEACIIALANIIFYWKTIYFGYVSDDFPSFQRNRPINKFLYAFWILEGKLKYKADVDHAITLVLHTLVCVGIYYAFGHNDISFIAALLFSFNPINNQGAVWISGRSYVLGSLGLVWALASPMGVGGLLLLIATYTNCGFYMPIVLLGSSRPELFIFAPLVWMYNFNNFKTNVIKKAKIEVFYEDALIHPKKLILAIKTFGFYVSHSIIPIKTTFYHSLLESIAGAKVQRAYSLCRFFWFGLFSLALMGWYVFTHKWDMVSFGILWWCIGIGPFLNLYRMQQEIGERYAYMPNIGLMFVLAYFIHGNPFITGLFLAMYATKMWFYIDGYKNDFFLVEHSRMHSPDSWFGWHIAAMKRWEMKSYQEAFLYWCEAKKISPKEFKLLFNLAATLYMANQKVEAMKLLAEAEQNMPKGQEKHCAPLIWNFKRGQITILI